MKDSEVFQWVHDRHWHYCVQAAKFMEKLGREWRSPIHKLCVNNSRTAGTALYRNNVCQYNLAYVLAVREKYDRTIAHEVAHIVVNQLREQLHIRTYGHKDLFFFIGRELYGSTLTRQHCYKKRIIHVEKAELMLKMQKLQREIRRGMESNK